jgi:hypothetical protein
MKTYEMTPQQRKEFLRELRNEVEDGWLKYFASIEESFPSGTTEPASAPESIPKNEGTDVARR